MNKASKRIAGRTARAVAEPAVCPLPRMQISTDFWASKTLAAAHDLDIFTHIADAGRATAESLARALRVALRPAEMLLTGCASLGLLERRGDRYANSAVADAFLVRGRPYYFDGGIEMLDRRLYPWWGNLTGAIHANRPTTWDPDRQGSLFEGEGPVMLAVFWEAMHSLSTFTARVLGEAVDLSSYRRLRDVGGGSAAYDVELYRRYPQLTATVYDLPFVEDIAARKIADAGLSGRIQTVAGDFFADASLPAGHDVILLSMILHDWREERCREILRKCYAALPGGGALIVSELLVNDEKTGPAPAALMSLHILIETEGRNYASPEYGGGCARPASSTRTRCGSTRRVRTGRSSHARPDAPRVRRSARSARSGAGHRAPGASADGTHAR